MKSCEKITRLNDRAEFEKISFGQKLSIFFHNLICKMCRTYSKDSAVVSKAIKAIPEEKMTEEEKSRIKNSLPS